MNCTTCDKEIPNKPTARQAQQVHGNWHCTACFETFEKTPDGEVLIPVDAAFFLNEDADDFSQAETVIQAPDIQSGLTEDLDIQPVEIDSLDSFFDNLEQNQADEEEDLIPVEDIDSIGDFGTLAETSMELVEKVTDTDDSEVTEPDRKEEPLVLAEKDINQGAEVDTPAESALEEEPLFGEENDLEMSSTQEFGEAEIETQPSESTTQAEPVELATKPVSEAISAESTSNPNISETAPANSEVFTPEPEALELTRTDLSAAMKPMVLRLVESELRENNVIPVIRLLEYDLASLHRRVLELSESFFEDHGIRCDASGVILLKKSDLVRRKVERPSRPRRAPIVLKESYWTDQRIVRTCFAVTVFCLVGAFVSQHLQNSWVTVTQDEYDRKIEHAGWLSRNYNIPIRYRVEHDVWYSWFGRRLLTDSSYEAAKENHGWLTWMIYDTVNSETLGDRLD